VTAILAIDTASASFAVAFMRDGGPLRSTGQAAAADHSRLLLQAIADVLDGDRPEVVAVVRGPGSYAGVRVGLATAAGFGLSRGLRIVGVGTLEAVAAAAGPGTWTAIQPAGRGTFAAQRFADGEAIGDMWSATAAELGPEQHLAGEGAGVLGGLEVSIASRCVAAGRLAEGRLASATGEPPPALYLREPSITPPRRPAGSVPSAPGN
jgi:tRNA threonylcarbamoyladenosine biosynthesis protein TsaB